MTFQKYLNTKGKLAESLNLEKEAVRILILELSNMSGAEFFANLNKEIPADLLKTFDDALDKYLNEKVPVQHIIGYSWFYGYKMKVSNKVLIPRPETEELVGYVLSYYDEVFDGKKVDVIDVGTGSGAIAIALACEESNMCVSASDISAEAVEVAEENAKNNNANVKFYVGDMLQPFIDNNYKVDILVSNPPYIPDEEYVEDIVKNNEPNVALFGGSDGMYFYDIILSNASKVVKEKSIIAFEHSHLKGKEMIEISKKYFPNAKVELIKDLNGKDRFTIIVNN